MIIQWIGIASATFAGVALILNYFAFRRQQRNFQLNLLVDLSSKLLELSDKRKEYDKEKKVGEYSVLFSNFLEWLAYLINHRYIPKKMGELFHGIIINWHEKVIIEQKDMLADYTGKVESGFSELKKLYEKIKKQ